MDARIQLQPAYVIHTRPFQNSSLLVDFYCLDYGRLRAIARGARRQKSRYRSLLQLFHPLLISLAGKGEVKTLTGLESSHSAIELQGRSLFSGLYLNELLTHLLHLHVEHHQLYRAYQEALLNLASNQPIEPILRNFEMDMLVELGYGIDFSREWGSEQPLNPGTLYQFNPGAGFEAVREGASASGYRVFSGDVLLSINNRQFSDPRVLKSAKHLLRSAIAAQLGGKELMSRNLFQDHSREG